MYGVKTESMRVIGNTIRCMDMAKFSGLMVANMKANMKMIKSMVLEYGLILITANSKYFMKMGR